MLKPLKLVPFTTDEIKPSGWLKKQLELQAKGLSGNLDKIWPDIKDSRWIGGDKEGWERVPYWLDGFIPLAYLLDDEDMKARAKRYIDAIIDNQKPDGFLCPCEDSERSRYDMWALHLIGKVLVVYYECSKDERIEQVLYDALKNYRAHVNRYTIFDWAATRWFECLIPIYWIYERRQEDWLIELAHILSVQGADYEKLFSCLSMDRAKEFPHWSYLDHVVNMGMAIKSQGLYSRISGESADDFAKTMVDTLHKKHGTVTGHFNGDECLSGVSPTAGTECCGVVEAMYSYEHLIALTADNYWADLLEMLAYNALPATISPDMWTHQYDQMTNQIEVVPIPKEQVHFTSNGGSSHIFGLEPNFGCCTANFNQAWPKLALSTFMRSERGIAITAIAPATLECTVNGSAVKIEVITDYPFRDTMQIKVTANCSFELMVRIPGFVKSAKVDGNNSGVVPQRFYTIQKDWSGVTVIDVEFEMSAEFVRRPNDMVAVKRGGLIYSIAIDEEWTRVEYSKNGVDRIYPYCDYTIRPKSEWSYGYLDDNLTLELRNITDMPFSPEHAPIQLIANMALLDWDKSYGVCAEKPNSLVPISDPVKVRLIPYGCTNLRMTEVPLLTDISNSTLPR